MFKLLKIGMVLMLGCLVSGLAYAEVGFTIVDEKWRNSLPQGLVNVMPVEVDEEGNPLPGQIIFGAVVKDPLNFINDWQSQTTGRIQIKPSEQGPIDRFWSQEIELHGIAYSSGPALPHTFDLEYWDSEEEKWKLVLHHDGYALGTSQDRMIILDEPIITKRVRFFATKRGKQGDQIADLVMFALAYFAPNAPPPPSQINPSLARYKLSVKNKSNLDDKKNYGSWGY